MNVNSPDISTLDFSVLFNISGATPTIVLTNLSTGPDLPSCTWWYVVTSPSGTVFHQGSFSNPDATGNWTTLTLPANAWPQPFGQIEWSGVGYSVTLYVRDGANNTFSLTYSATICRPSGNNAKTVGNFGTANVYVESRCDIARLYAEDRTNYTYQNEFGTPVSQEITLAFPADDEGNQPAPQTVTDLPNALFAIQYNGNYSVIMNTVRDYAIGSNVTVRIRYKAYQEFKVQCNIDLCAIIGELNVYFQKINAECGTNIDASTNTKLLRLLTLTNQAMIAKQQPLCGIDVSKIVEEIMELGNFSCDCIIPGGGINGSSAIAQILVEPGDTCGDMTITVTQQAQVFKINAKDFTYLFELTPEAVAAGFTIGTATDANTCTKTVTIGFDGAAGNVFHIIPVYDFDQKPDQVPFVECPQLFTVKGGTFDTYSADGTSYIGVSHRASDIAALMNGATASTWPDYGTAIVIGDCSFLMLLNPGVDPLTVPPLYLKHNP